MADLEGNLALLAANNLADFDALFAAADRHIIDGHRSRSVSRLELRDEAGRPVVVYVKRQWGRGAKRPWRDLLRFRWPELPARREWRSALSLRAAGIAVAEPVAFGCREGRGGPRTLLVCREVDGPSLAALLPRLPPGASSGPTARARHQVARALGAAVRRLHDAGFSLPDLYAKHIYIEEPESPEPRVVFIDPQRLRRFTPGRARADLAALLATTMEPPACRGDHYRVLAAYMGTARLTAEARALVGPILARAMRIAGRGLDPNLLTSRRTAPPGLVPLAEEKPVLLDGGRLRVNEAFLPALEAAGLTSLDAIMAFRAGESYRDVPGRLTVRAELADPAGVRIAVYIKRYSCVPWKTRLARLLAPGEPDSFAMAEGKSIVRLQDAGIATMRIVAIGEEVSGRGLSERSCLITQEVPDAIQADMYCEAEFGPAAPGRGTSAKRRLIRAIADLARRFHGARFTHRDFYLCHILVRSKSEQMGSDAFSGRMEKGSHPISNERRGPEKVPDTFSGLHLIDLQRVQCHRRGVPERWVVKDLAALLFSSMPSAATHIRSPVFTRTDRMRFAREYFGTRRLSPEVKRLIRRVIAKAQAMARHECRRQARKGAAG
jgi:hypothetical protein